MSLEIFTLLVCYSCIKFSVLIEIDTSNNRVRKVSHLDGTITTIAGTGFGGYNGDGILATDAQINTPSGVAVDSKGSVYIAGW